MSGHDPVRRMTDRSLATRIGQTARSARMRAALTQSDVAERIGVVTEVYGRMERGNMLPSVPTFFRLCVVLGMSADAAFELVEKDERTRLESPPSTESKEPRELRRLMRRLRAMDRPHLLAFTRIFHEVSRLLKGRQRLGRPPRGSTP